MGGGVKVHNKDKRMELILAASLEKSRGYKTRKGSVVGVVAYICSWSIFVSNRINLITRFQFQDVHLRLSHRPRTRAPPFSK